MFVQMNIEPNNVLGTILLADVAVNSFRPILDSLHSLDPTVGLRLIEEVHVLIAESHPSHDLSVTRDDELDDAVRQVLLLKAQVKRCSTKFSDTSVKAFVDLATVAQFMDIALSVKFKVQMTAIPVIELLALVVATVVLLLGPVALVLIGFSRIDVTGAFHV